MIGNFLRPDIRGKVATVGNQILTHVYAFFKGQITVACLLGVLYALGLWAVGLPSAFVIGILSGVLNVVPYLGVAFGLTISTVLTMVGDGEASQLFLVWGVFALVQVLDAVLSRFQSLNSSGYGSPELSQHIYSIDKLLNEMRKGEFSKLERTLDRPRVGGMAVEPDVPPLPVGSGFPGPAPEASRPGGFGTGAEPVVEEVPPPQP